MKAFPTSCIECRRRKKKCTHNAVLLGSVRSCTECYKRKKKCNLQEPCSNCTRRYPPADCIYPQLNSKYGSKASSDAGKDLALRLREDSSDSTLIRIQSTSPLIMIENCKVNRSQLVALNEDFLSIDSMFDVNCNLHDAQTLYHCLYQLTNGSETLDVALQALCLMQLSIRNKDGRLKVESMMMNGKALKLLHRALRNPAAAYETETVAASLCVKTFEELACQIHDATGVRQLTEGTRLLVRQRGPASYAKPLDHIIFARWFREYDIYHSLAQEVPTFLAGQGWCNLPWSHIEKNDNDRLIDIIAAYADVRGEVTHLETAGYSSEELTYAEKILLTCHELNDALARWLDSFEKTILGPMFSAVTWGDDKVSKELFSYKFQFANLKIAMLYLKYWPTFILLNGSMFRIEKYFLAAEAALDPSHLKHRPGQSLRPGFDGSKMTDFAMNICRGLDYALDHTMRSSGPIYLTYPIIVIHLYIWTENAEKLRSWCGEKLRQIQNSGYEFVNQYDAHRIRGSGSRGLKLPRLYDTQ